MFNNIVDINKFIGEDIDAERLEFLLNEQPPIVELNEEEFFKLPVSEAYRVNQEKNKKILEEEELKNLKIEKIILEDILKDLDDELKAVDEIKTIVKEFLENQ